MLMESGMSGPMSVDTPIDPNVQLVPGRGKELLTNIEQFTI